MNFFWPDISAAELLIRTLGVFFFLLFIIRISGKRDIGEMSPSDLLVLLLVSACVHTSIIGEDKSLAGGLIGAVLLLGANQVLSRIARSNVKLERFIKGQPEVLIRNGKIREDVLKKHRMTRAQLKTALRKEGHYRFADVRLAVLEPDGVVSIIEYPDAHPKASFQKTFSIE